MFLHFKCYSYGNSVHFKSICTKCKTLLIVNKLWKISTQPRIPKQTINAKTIYIYSLIFFYKRNINKIMSNHPLLLPTSFPSNSGQNTASLYLLGKYHAISMLLNLWMHPPLPKMRLHQSTYTYCRLLKLNKHVLLVTSPSFQQLSLFWELWQVLQQFQVSAQS